jgi:hypothetical protein
MPNLVAKVPFGQARHTVLPLADADASVPAVQLSHMLAPGQPANVSSPHESHAVLSSLDPSFPCRISSTQT